MSKQLAISAAFAVFTMAAFTLTATHDNAYTAAHTQTGATTHAATPAAHRIAPALFDLFG